MRLNAHDVADQLGVEASNPRAPSMETTRQHSSGTQGTGMNSPQGGDRIASFLIAHLTQYLEDLRQLCAIDSFTEYKRGVDAVGEWICAWAIQHGWTTQVVADDRVGSGVIVTVQGGSPSGIRPLLAAHMDTVYPVGVAHTSLRRRGDRLLAPGIADNKGGLLSGLYALAALDALRMLEPFAAVSLFCGGDEETDMRASEAILSECAARSDCAFVLEPAREDGSVVTERKGVADIVLDVRGRAVHAGIEPEKGANAIVSIAQQVAALHRLNGIQPGVSVNIGTIGGGSASNVVADRARAVIDVRFVAPEQKELLEHVISTTVREASLARTSCTITASWILPMARTSANDWITTRAQTCARDLGFKLPTVSTGGVSYANLLAGFGVPVLDGLGPIGGSIHNSRQEYIMSSSIVPRTALLGLLLVDMATQGPRRQHDAGPLAAT